MKKLLLLLMFVLGCSTTTLTHAVPNLVRVDPTNNIWRSGQPSTPEGWAYIKSLGVQRVIKLNFESEGSDQGASDAGIEVIYVPIEPDENLMDVVKPVDSSHVAQALKALKLGNALVHCTHGQDRTGLVVGALRVEQFGWSKHQAWKEMLANHFHWELPGLMDWWLDFSPQ